MRRVSISEIMHETGLSRATVDRVLNRRGRVHPRTRVAVEETLRRLEAPDGAKPPPGPPVDIVLRLGRGMLSQMRAAWDAVSPSGRFLDLYQGRENDVVAAVRDLGQDLSRPLVIAAKNTDRLTDQLRRLRQRGKRVIAVVSDLASDARDCFVGIDNRAAGQTAAFLIGQGIGDKPASVGVVVGDSAFRCHEDREIGFRTGLRAHFPKIALAAEARGEDNSDLTREAVARMLSAHPDLSAVYNVGGGNLGLAQAIRDAGRGTDVIVVGHEVNSVTAPLLREGAMTFAIASDPCELLSEALRLAVASSDEPMRDSVQFDFAVYTRFNLPKFGIAASIPREARKHADDAI